MTIRHFNTRVVLYPLLALAVTALLISLGIQADLSKSDWASWVQAIGSITAIVVAFQIGSKQGKDAIAAIVFGYDHATFRKYQAYSVIVQAALKHSETCLTVYKPDGFNLLQTAIEDIPKSGDSILIALQAIPIHEVGTFEAVAALLEIKISMEYLGKAVLVAKAKIESFGSSPPFYIQHDCGVIHLNADVIKFHSTAFMAAMAVSPTA